MLDDERFWFFIIPIHRTPSEWPSWSLKVHQQLDDVDVRLTSIEQADHTDLDWCDGLALGSPTNYGSRELADETMVGPATDRELGQTRRKDRLRFLFRRSLGWRPRMDLHGADVDPDQLRLSRVRLDRLFRHQVLGSLRSHLSWRTRGRTRPRGLPPTRKKTFRMDCVYDRWTQRRPSSQSNLRTI